MVKDNAVLTAEIGKESRENKENYSSFSKEKKNMAHQEEVTDPLSPRITKYFQSNIKEVDGCSSPKKSPLKEPVSHSDNVKEVSLPQQALSSSKTISDTEHAPKQNVIDLEIQNDKPAATVGPSAGAKSKHTTQGKKSIKKPSSIADSTSQPRPKTTKKKKSTTEVKSHMLTDYFPVRRSERRTKKDIKEEEQKHIHEAILSGKEEGLKVVDFEDKGRGVVATKAFKRGEFVVEYAGDLIDLEEAKRRDAKYATDSKYGCYMYYFVFKNKNYCVDATAESGRLGRLLNHSSKSGNCVTKLMGVNDTPHLLLVAARDIETGEELTYDYGDRSKTSLEAHPWLKT